MDKKNREGIGQILQNQLSVFDMQLDYLIQKKGNASHKVLVSERKQEHVVPKKEKIEQQIEPVVVEEVRKEDKIPLTYEQKRLYVQACQDEKSNISYNQCMLFRVEGEFQKEYFEEIINKICNNHDILRTNKIEEAFLSVSGESHISVTYIEIEGESSKKQEQVVAFVQKEMETPFQLDADCFLKPYILKLSSSKHIIFIKIHHMIADGWSLNIILTDMLHLYQQKLNGQVLVLPQAPQYKEFQAKLEQESQSKQREDAIQYWKEKLTKKTEEIALLEHQNTAREEKAGLEEAVLSGEICTNLKKFCKEKSISLFHMLLSVYTVFINRVLDVESFVIGVPFSGQLKCEADRLVGHCVNMIPLYVFMDDEQSFEAHMNQMKKEFIQVSKYQLFSINEMIEEVIKEEEQIYIPNVKLAFNLDKVVVDGFQIGDTKFTSERPDQYVQESIYDFFFDILEQKDQIVLRLNYNASAVPKELAELWLGYMENIIYNVTQEADTKLYEIELENNNIDKRDEDV